MRPRKAPKITLPELKELHVTKVEKFFNDWVAKEVNQRFLNEYPQPDITCDYRKVILKCLGDGKNPFIANGSRIWNTPRKFEQAEKIVNRWKDKHQFDVIHLILNWERQNEMKGFYKVDALDIVKDPILVLDAYASIIALDIVKAYVDERRSNC